MLFSNKNKTKGVYFAKDACTSLSYGNTDPKIRNGLRCMLLCRVLIGDTAKGSARCKPPLKSDGITQVETLVDNIDNPRIFVSTRDYVALPVYYIWYTKRYKPYRFTTHANVSSSDSDSPFNKYNIT